MIADDMGNPPQKPALTLIGSAATVPAPPRPLGTAGLGLWNRIQTEFHIVDSGGAEVLAQACGALDLVEALGAAIATDGPVIHTRAGPKTHPAVKDQLAARALCARLLSRLGVTNENVQSPGRPPSFSSWTGP
jgi:Phage terminase, small subunit